MKRILAFLMLSLVLAACAPLPAPVTESAPLPTFTSAPTEKIGYRCASSE